MEALALLLDLGLTEAKYERLRKGAMDRGFELYPPYYLVAKEKAKLQVPQEMFEHPCEGVYQVSMQSVMDHHMSKIVDDDIADLIRRYARDRNNKFKMYFKYGADGMGTMRQYRSEVNQSNVYASYLTPVMLEVVNLISGKCNHLYVNRMANSWTSITYLRLAYEKESKSKPSTFVHICLPLSNYATFV